MKQLCYQGFKKRLIFSTMATSVLIANVTLAAQTDQPSDLNNPFIANTSKEAGFLFSLQNQFVFSDASYSDDLIDAEIVLNSDVIDLTADVNHDGFIDLLDDELAEEESSGVIVLPNLDDDALRCQHLKETENDLVIPTDAFIKCNDAADFESNGADDIDDLSLISLNVDASLADNTQLTLSLLNSQGQLDNTGKFRVLVERGDKFIDINQSPVSLDDAKQGIMLAVEATDIVRSDSEWDGKAQLSATLTIDDQIYSDDIPLVVAPLITQHDLGTAEKLFVAPTPFVEGSDNKRSEYNQVPSTLESLKKEHVSNRFVSDIKAASDDIVEEVVLLKDTSGDIWAQDLFEPAFASKPSPEGSQTIRIMLRSANITRNFFQVIAQLDQFDGQSEDEIYDYLFSLSDEDYFKLWDQASQKAVESGTMPHREGGITLYSEMRGPGVGVVEVASSNLSINGNDSYNSTGNFTTAPPTFNTTTDFPLGRMVYGSTPNVRFIDILKSQSKQEPVWVDTSWLYVGHVDEFMTILPSISSPRGWVLGVADPDLAYQVLKHAQSQTDENLILLNNRYSLEYSQETNDYTTVVPKALSVADFLADDALKASNQFASSKIEEAVVILKKELGLSDDEIIRLPALYKAEGHSAESPVESQSLGSLIPNAVNGVYLGDYQFISPKQFGPTVNGIDVLQQAFEEAIYPHGVDVRWVDDYNYAHLGLGEIHCVTNTYRDLSDVDMWWNTDLTVRPINDVNWW